MSAAEERELPVECGCGGCDGCEGAGGPYCEEPPFGWYGIGEDRDGGADTAALCVACAAQLNAEASPTCGHSACRQHWIDTGAGSCFEYVTEAAERLRELANVTFRALLPRRSPARALRLAHHLLRIEDAIDDAVSKLLREG